MFDLIPIGLILLAAAGVLILLGVGQRVLDRMRLTDAQALILLGVMFAGAFLPEIPVAGGLSVDVGGALAPLAVAIYLIVTAGTAMEKNRAVVASVVTAALLYATDRILPADPGRTTFPTTLDPVLMPGVLGGLVAYALGRSRRSAFIAGTLGVVLTDLGVLAENLFRGIPGAVAALGGAGVFDASVLAGFIGVALAEIIGESREFLQGGPRQDRPPGLLKGLRGRVRIGAEGGDPGDLPPGDARGPAAPGRGGEGGMSLAMALALVSLSLAVAGGSAILGPRLGGADDDEVLSGPLFTMRDQSGEMLMRTGRRVHLDDEYIDQLNRRFRVVEVDGRAAVARFVGYEDLNAAAGPPAAVGLTGPGSVPALAGRLPGRLGKRDVTVGIYHTHNDESYVPTQRTESVEGRGGIHRVGKTFADEMDKRGYRVAHNESIHLPHDRGAYRRSRRTANKLLQEKKADLLFDVHRDAGPWDLYGEKVKGRWVTQVRLVVGRENPQMQANLNYAKQLKAVADDLYPGLMKGIFLGRDAFNQDLSSRAVLIEVGTEQNALPSARKGMSMFADVVDRWVDKQGAGGAGK